MLLVITNSDDETANYLCGLLEKTSVSFCRFDTDLPVTDLDLSCDGCRLMLTVRGERIEVDRVSNIWFRRPKPLTVDASAEKAEVRHTSEEWAEAIEGFLAHVPIELWMNHPSRNFHAGHKIEQLTRAQRFGIAVPRSIVTQDPSKARSFWAECDGRLIVKPLSAGLLERDDGAPDKLIYTRRVSRNDLDDTETLRKCPTLFQEEIEKKCDIRLTVVDEHAHAVSLKPPATEERQRVDIRRNNMQGVEYNATDLPATLNTKILRLIRSYGLRFAAVDLVVSPSGEWYFLEINPNGQWAWLDLVGGANIAASFISSFKGKNCEGS